MATEAGIVRVFAFLRHAGCKAPEGWAGVRPSEIAASWAMLLPDVSDEDLGAAAVAFARQGGKAAAFFPAPGDLLALASPRGDGKAALETLATADFEGLLLVYHRNGGRYAQVTRLSRDDARNARMTTALDTIGGWPAVRRACDAEDDGFTMGALRRSWSTAYRALGATLGDPHAALARLEAAPPARQIEARPDGRHERALRASRLALEASPDARAGAAAFVRDAGGGE